MNKNKEIKIRTTLNILFRNWYAISHSSPCSAKTRHICVDFLIFLIKLKILKKVETDE